LNPLVYINGILIDPRKTNFSTGCLSIALSGGARLVKDDKFTVIIEYFDQYISSDVVL